MNPYNSYQSTFKIIFHTEKCLKKVWKLNRKNKHKYYEIEKNTKKILISISTLNKCSQSGLFPTAPYIPASDRSNLDT